jgi:microsomal dipeptidase-like Zn-dependent dipeptidase
MKVSAEAMAFHERCVVADMHAHPSLKTYLLGEKFHRPHRPGKHMGVFTMQTSLPSLRKGSVDIQVATHYVPERGLADDCIVVEGLSKVIPRLRHALKEPLEATRAMMSHFEGAVARGSKDEKGRKPRLVRSLAELDAALKDGDIAVIHAVEGAHSLGGNAATVDEFFERGVCMLTLAHFYENECAPPVEGIPYDFFLRKIGCFKHKHDATKSLPEFGREVVERMIDRGMLIDLTHCTPAAREAVCEINGKRRPLVLSHIGLKELMPHELNVTGEEVKRIADTGGVVGVILMPYYLTVPRQEKGFEPIVETLRRLIQHAGEDGVGFGSDYDGFTDPPDDVKEPAEYPRLTEELLKAFGERQTEKILGANFLRVLRSGWGR